MEGTLPATLYQQKTTDLGYSTRNMLMDIYCMNPILDKVLNFSIFLFIFLVLIDLFILTL